MVFIVLAYGLFGLFAAAALVINVLLIVAFMSLTQATLTLPGIAGLILTLAVAVDANVLIYERMRDEGRAGRSLILTIDSGYRLAWPSIMDANVTTLISAAIMFQFGSGPVKGFAWTLSIGVLTSVFTAILVTQVLDRLVVPAGQTQATSDLGGIHALAPLPSPARPFAHQLRAPVSVRRDPVGHRGDRLDRLFRHPRPQSRHRLQGRHR